MNHFLFAHEYVPLRANHLFGMNSFCFWCVVFDTTYIAYVCILYIYASKVHWAGHYCEKPTVEETGHFTWTMFRQHDTR